MGALERFRRKHSHAYKWIISLLCFLFVIFLAFLGGGLGWDASDNDRRLSRNKLSIPGKFFYDSVTGKFQLGDSASPALTGVLSASAKKSWFSTPCSKYSGTGVCLEWTDQVRVTIESDIGESVNCHTIRWQALDEHFTPRDCFFIGNDHWYGGAEVSNQRWSIETGSQYQRFPMMSGGYVTGWIGGYIQGVVERYWLSSNGISIKADDTIPLFVDWNAAGDGNFCLEANYSRPYQKVKYALPSLKYTICQADDMKTVHLASASKFFPKPKGQPDSKMLVDPVWTTWAKYHININQSNILMLAEQLATEGYTISQLEIDDRYSTSYGMFDFDPENFPNATGMIGYLKALGMRVTAWAHPFANVGSPIFQEGLEKKYWITDLTGRVPALVEWWDGVAGVLDVTNPGARKWFVDRLKAFQNKYQIDSFKFDAGQASNLPPSYTLHTPLNSSAFFTTKYVEMCSEFGPMIEVRVGYRNQDQPIFFRLHDMDSTWNYDNGLKSLIPRVLLFGLVGYPFVLPDIIGGNAYNGEFPDKELFIRWMQVSAFLPSWQFSIVPGQYDNNTATIAKNMMNIRRTFLKPFILKYAAEAVKTGYPIVRPLWWLSPEDTTVQTIDSQFLIGNDVLVAPVLDKGVITRDVYLPAGRWRDQNSNQFYNGTSWLKDHPVSLEQIAYFLRLD